MPVESKQDQQSLEYARSLDQTSSVNLRDHFHLPEFTYFCGNSLGLQPKSTKQILNEEIDIWAKLGVDAHFEHPLNRPWVDGDLICLDVLSAIVGAKQTEVALMGTLTTNLHLLMISFYKPTKERFKILTEPNAFPSDVYALESQAAFHGFDPKEAIIHAPVNDEGIVSLDDIKNLLAKRGNEIAVVMLGGVNYYSGQVYDMKAITDEAHKYGCIVGFDLAHAVGNVALKLHDWSVDFACWCSYKYLNAGPGGLAGIYVNERHFGRQKLHGWWGQSATDRFYMKEGFRPLPSARSFQLSNPCVVAVACHYASMQIFARTSIEELNAKSRKLTGYLRFLIETNLQGKVKIITPITELHGAQLSLRFPQHDYKVVFDKLEKQNIVTDLREPDVIRISPAPLYNTFEECYRTVAALKEILQ